MGFLGLLFAKGDPSEENCGVSRQHEGGLVGACLDG